MLLKMHTKNCTISKIFKSKYFKIKYLKLKNKMNKNLLRKKKYLRLNSQVSIINKNYQEINNKIKNHKK